MLSAVPRPVPTDERVPASFLEGALDFTQVSQSELARRLRVSQTTVNRWARDKAPITWLSWLAITQALGLGADWEPDQATE